MITAKGQVYFDRDIIRHNWGAINRTPIRRAGLVIRKVAIRSIRKRSLSSKERYEKKYQEYQRLLALGMLPRNKKPPRVPYSKPGSPPYSWDKQGRLRMIYSVPYDEDTNPKAIVGAVGFGSKDSPTPGVHEQGLARRVPTRNYKVSLKRRKLRFLSRGTKERHTLAYKQALAAGRVEKPKREYTVQVSRVRYPKRPFMAPALQKSRKDIAKFWKNSVNPKTVATTFPVLGTN